MLAIWQGAPGCWQSRIFREMFSSAGYFSGSASCCIGMQVHQAQRPKRKGVEIPITILNNAASSSEVLEFVRHAEISEASQAVQAHETDPGHAKEAQRDRRDCGPYC